MDGAGTQFTLSCIAIQADALGPTHTRRILLFVSGGDQRSAGEVPPAL
jgi:hypothetical protein